MQNAVKWVRWTPMAWITWPCTDGALVPPANEPLALFSPQLDPLRNRFQHFDSSVCIRSVCSLMWLPSASESSTIRFSPPCNALSRSPPGHPSHPPLRLSPSSVCPHSIHSLLPLLHPSIVLALLFSPSHPSPPLLPSTPGWILPWCVSTAHSFCPSFLILLHLHLILLSFPFVLPSPPNTTPVCSFISPCLTVLFLTSASVTHTHIQQLSLVSLLTPTL